MKPSFHVQVDASNPGEFLACCGILEIADRLWSAEAWFDRKQFAVATSGTLQELLVAVTEREPLEQLTLDGGLEVKPLIAPLHLNIGGVHTNPLVLDAWMRVREWKGQVEAVGNAPWNFWSGQQTSLRIWTGLREALIRQLEQIDGESTEDLLSNRAPLTGRFGFDPGAAWNALDAGFSPNEQGMAVASSPAVEILAAIGLQRFRPAVSKDKSTFTYCTWHHPLSPPAAAAAACGAMPTFEESRWRGRVVSRGSYAALGYSTPKGPDND